MRENNGDGVDVRAMAVTGGAAVAANGPRDGLCSHMRLEEEIRKRVESGLRSRELGTGSEGGIGDTGGLGRQGKRRVLHGAAERGCGAGLGRAVETGLRTAEQPRCRAPHTGRGAEWAKPGMRIHQLCHRLTVEEHCCRRAS
jgi:hypothetical protein